MKKKSSVIMDSFIELPLRQLYTVPIIVVYNSLLDFPGKYVARLWDIHNRPTAYVMLKDTLDEIRAGIPETMVRLDRAETDDPVIVESWL
jgi:hypothetical protein